ncbi:MAG: dTDP-4-dehydrorhamnose reductase [candidate division WOR-3 bacterium]
MILVTGASGCLGSKVADLLDDVWAPDRSELDLERPADVFRTLIRMRPKVIFHAGAWTDVDACETNPQRAHVVNWVSTRAIASAAIRLDAILVYISTDYVFGGEKDLYNENDEPNPVNVYGRTKLLGEREALRVPQSYVVRTSWVFGPGGKTLLSRFLDYGAQGKPLTLITDQVSRPTYVMHLASLVLDFARGRLPFGVYHLAGSADVTYADFVKRGLELAGIKTDLRLVRSSELNRPAKRPLRSSLSSELYEALTGKRVPGWEETLEEYVEWWINSKGK